VGGPVTKNILYGEAANLWPDFVYGSAVIDHGVGAVTSGASAIVSPVVSTTYTLTVTNLAGDSVVQSVAVNVATVVVNPVAPATKTITVGHTYTFTSSVTGAADPSLNWSVDGVPGGNATVGTIVGGLYTAPATPGSHTVTASSNANVAVSQNASLTIVDAPSIDTPLVATPGAIPYGGTSVLSATYAHGTANLAGGATNTNPASSPVNFTTPALTSTTSYTLTVTNAAGDFVTSTATVTVSAVTMTALAPATKYVSQTKTLQVTGGVVSGVVDASVTWQVNGVAGGNATYGTIDASGLYTAPATVPGSPVVTVTCMSNAENAITQTMAITLVNLPAITSFTVN
jgi:hypothetical protein